jgi:hypothetical protein
MNYGCHSKPLTHPLTASQDGWHMDGYTRTPRMVHVPFAMSRECNYTTTTLGKADTGCTGCTRRATA